MFLSLETDSNIAPFKMKAIELSLSRKLPHAAAQKLGELLKSDNIPDEEFIAELNKIVASSETLSGKTLFYFSNLKASFIDQVVKISPFQVGFILLFFIIGFFFYKKYISKSKKRAKYVFGLTENLLERFYAFLAYFLTILQLCATYLGQLCYLLNLWYPDFLDIAGKFYLLNANYISWGQFFVVLFIVLRLKKPRSRFVRFHIVRGLVLCIFQSIPPYILTLFIGPPNLLNQTQQINVYMFFVVINLYFILPSVAQALTHTYPKNAFLREATEVILGRDDDPEFKWWDRDY